MNELSLWLHHAKGRFSEWHSLWKLTLIHVGIRGTLTEEDDDRLNGVMTAGDMAFDLPDKVVAFLVEMFMSLIRMTTNGDWEVNAMAELDKVDFEPLADRVLVLRDANTRTAGGVLLPDSQKKKVTRGVVLAVGPGKLSSTGERLPMHVKVGDRVLFGHYAAYECSINGKEYLVMSQDDILGIDRTGTSTVL